MALSQLAERYRVDLTGLQAACEANYARLMRLLPGMREQAALRQPMLGQPMLGQPMLGQPVLRRLALSAGDTTLAVLALRVTEAGPYTSTVEVREEPGLAWLPAPRLEVRVYHDARMAEVTGAEHCRRLHPRYAYPNPAMHQPDEKIQLNLFLGEWLSHYLRCGHLAENPVDRSVVRR
ncbi:DUF1249 domain-containing protein [Pseudomonas sp. A-1]|uniref:DUF1249 domain-containing protein n=1 Tax=Pseudomonas sp. A-1 TaxID=1821274 RepID=UPI0010A67AA7|nr:DUF1249 domain-containing protein [Pseudomonas sp. A-1]THG82507.1 DUF1249 domain-containing protein [Pseudomonas sp. A-1]